MKRFLALVTLLFALAGITMPSLAMGSRGWISAPVPVVTMQPGGSYVRGPCQFTGGKILSPCRPDLGVMPVALFLTPTSAVLPRPLLVEIMPSPLPQEPILPPPRQG